MGLRHGRSDEEVVDGEVGDRHAARVAGRLEYRVQAFGDEVVVVGL